MKRLAIVLLFVVLGGPLARGEEGKPLLLRQPTVNRTHVAFVYGDDLWLISREGGDARRLTTGLRVDDPAFSPDGKHLAFTGNDRGTVDIYVMPAAGGVARRLTYHPGPEHGAAGWTPDSRRVLFLSSRSCYSNGRHTQLFTVGLEGGLPAPLPLPMAYQGSYSPDGSRIAYVPLPSWIHTWKRYRGGQATAVWLADLADSHIEKIPRTDSNDWYPMWIGKRIFFLSDRDGPFTLFAYDPASKKVKKVLENDGLDIKSASAGPDVIVYEQFGSLHLFDPATLKQRKLHVRIPADLPGVRPRLENVAKQIENADISPTGARAVFEAHGEILTVPAVKGDVQNLTSSPGAAERDPAWSPDGKSIAYFSDESGEYELHVRPARGGRDVKKYTLGKAPSYYRSPVWSPDSGKIAYNDQRLNIWCIDLGTGKNTLVDAGMYMDDRPVPAWSPDSRWLTYARQLKNAYRAVFLFSLASGKRHQITDGLSDARHPVFDRSGKYLYFTSSTDIGQSVDLVLDMATIGRPFTRRVHAVVLRDDLPSPLAPESDEEAGKEKPARDKDRDTEAGPLRIDLEDIDLRILTLPLPPRSYRGLLAGKEGVLFVLEGPPALIETDPGRWNNILHKFELEKRKSEKLLEGANDVKVSHNGEKLLYRDGQRWFIVPTAQPPKKDDGALKLDGMEIRVDPCAEWKQMYHEVWRVERDFLYDPGWHGLDLRAAEKKYAPYLDGISTRGDLNYLFKEMLGELSLGHVFVANPRNPDDKPSKMGLLGADYEIDNGRYRFARIYRGDNWGTDLPAPLLQPGSRVKSGEYLLAVNGHDVRPPENLYRLFEGTAGKSVELLVGPSADGKGARRLTVVPIDTGKELALRHFAWVDENRRKVEKLSGGRVAYIYVPDCFLDGFAAFNRYFYAQAGHEAAIIDERFNSGGIMPDYFVDVLSRRVKAFVATREGSEWVNPHGAIFGPKVLLINERSSSSGDLLAQMFRQAGVGKLIGKRAWGGAVGIGRYPTLMGGGFVTAPKAAYWFPSGKWELENQGAAPDIEVELDPKAVRGGHDPQLEKAVAVVLEELKKQPPRKRQRPAYPNYHKRP
jgi:tricorn protease